MLRVQGLGFRVSINRAAPIKTRKIDNLRYRDTHFGKAFIQKYSGVI